MTHNVNARPGFLARHTRPPWLKGAAFCAAGMAVSLVIAGFLPTVSPLLVAILLGALVANVTRLPDPLAPGIALVSKRVLRVGIVLLGLSVSLHEIAGLGLGMIAVVVAVVGIGIWATLWLGKLLGIPAAQRLLIGCGFSICGAAAVAAVDGVTDSSDEDVAAAVGLVVLYGTLMIFLVPLASSLLGLTENESGLWAGASIHEVAQVVAAGGTLGAGALTAAVIVKLARVLMLAPVLVTLGIVARRRRASTPGTRTPLVPLFVVGFIAMVLLASTGIVPEGVAGALGTLQTWCLSAAMFALGLGVRISRLITVGIKPVVLGALSTVVVGVVALAGVLLVS